MGKPELVNATIARTGTIDGNLKMTPDAIAQIIEQAPDMPVLWDFNPKLPSGRVLCASESDGKAELTVVLAYGWPDTFRLAPSYVVEGYEVDPEQPDVMRITKIKLVSVGLVVDAPKVTPRA